MRYYVIGADGQRYGPADVPTLNQWAQENRLLPTQMLEDESSGTRMVASSVEGLSFPVVAQPQPAPPYSQPGQPTSYGGGQPYQQHYGRPVYTGDDGSKDVTTAWVLGGIWFLCGCFLLPLFGLLSANKAQQKGHPGANAAKIFNIVLLVLNVIGIIFYGIMIASGGLNALR
jgi:hypothetical protein